MNAKLRVLEHILLLETYTQESIPALYKVRKYLVEATEEASLAYNKAGVSVWALFSCWYEISPHPSFSGRFILALRRLISPDGVLFSDDLMRFSNYNMGKLKAA
ncbi:AUGMIN subunit 4 [Camellia lanceoleosa]|uniref:AUGMIN subunit 4 n=1 Tax=Camellia lanceoleosa TaxID=1840588 RepID=A0ACC0IT16_9ERIC|nr:AUGMIN subunit 4 [Camellia lanceoleosa]